jgi:predicted nucleic-acid-binding protein
MDKKIGPGSEQISLVWHVDDVLEVAPKLTREEAMEVLETVRDNHDANIGVNWDILAANAEYLFPERVA